MPVITYYGKVLSIKNEDLSVIQSIPETTPREKIVKTLDVLGGVYIEHLGQFEKIYSGERDFFFLKKGGFFLCAPSDQEALEIDRLHPSEWEKFLITPNDKEMAETVSTFVSFALKPYAFGYSRQSFERLEKLKTLYPENDEVCREYGILKSSILKTSNNSIKMIINCPLDSMFEKEWLQYLLSDVPHSIVPATHDYKNENLIIIDSLIREDKIGFYKKLYENGNKILLIHLSDETFNDYLECYEWCHSVWRNLWSPLLSRQKKVSFFPLGYKNGYQRSLEPKKSDDRKYTWFFAGDIKKSSRQSMYENMCLIEGGYSHLTTYFNSNDALSTNDYRSYMDEAIFIPCAAGFVHLDSFRIYEALEAGCIPLIENSRDLDIFTPYLGPNPIPMIRKWDEVGPLVRNLMESGEVETLRAACYNWWQKHKTQIRTSLKDSVQRLVTHTRY